MKKNVVFIALSMAFVFCADSCVSIKDRELSILERRETNIIGSVSTSFTSFQLFHIQPIQKLKNKAYEQLMRAAQNRFSGNIDIANIKINGSFSLGELAWIVLPWAAGTGQVVLNLRWDDTGTAALAGGGVFYSLPILVGNFQRITAIGDVILLDVEAGTNLSIREKIQNLMPGINSELINKLPKNSRIAILSISSADKALAENVVDDVELNLVDSRRFIIVDRRRIDDIRREQNFQLSGDVSDDSAVSIGHMIGANVVIVGNITTITSRGRITIRALNVETGEVIVIASEQF
jgi:TolB-like protein